MPAPSFEKAPLNRMKTQLRWLTKSRRGTVGSPQTTVILGMPKEIIAWSPVAISVTISHQPLGWDHKPTESAQKRTLKERRRRLRLTWSSPTSRRAISRSSWVWALKFHHSKRSFRSYHSTFKSMTGRNQHFTPTSPSTFLMPRCSILSLIGSTISGTSRSSTTSLRRPSLGRFWQITLPRIIFRELDWHNLHLRLHSIKIM